MAKRFTAGDPRLTAMEQLARDPSASLDDEARMDAALRPRQGLCRPRPAGGCAAPSDRGQCRSNAKKSNMTKLTTLTQFDRIKEMMTRELIESQIRPWRRLGSAGVHPRHAALRVHLDRADPGEPSRRVRRRRASNFSEAVAGFCGGQARAAVPFTEVVPDMPAERLGELGADYLDSVRNLAPRRGALPTRCLPTSVGPA